MSEHDDILQEERWMFGETIDAMIRAKQRFPTPTLLYIMNILGENRLLADGDGETCRQFINKAKFFLTEELKRQHPEWVIHHP